MDCKKQHLRLVYLCIRLYNLVQEEFNFCFLLFVYRVDITKLKSSSKLFRKIISEPLNLCTDEHFEFLLKYLSLLHNSVIRPSKEYNECQESIKQIMAYRANHYTLKDIVF